MNKQKKVERRNGAAQRLTAQLDAGTKPEKINRTVTHIKGRKAAFTTSKLVPLTQADIQRIQRELQTLNA